MATSATNSTLKKEKKATPSSHPHTSTRKQGVSRPASPSSGYTNKDNSSTPSGKPIPNYLKPTFSSRPEPLKQVKKTGHEDTTQKPALLRRRSFDRPPSLHHHVQKLDPSSDPKERLGRDRIIGTARSSSFSSKNVTSPKTVVDRNAPTHKPGKSHQPLTTRTIGRSISLSNKKVTNAPVLPKEPVSHDGTLNLDLETMLESNEESFLAHETEEILNDVSEEQVPSDSPKAENEEVHIDAEETEVNNGEDEKLIKGSNIPTVAGGEINVSALAKPVEETETELHQENEDQHEGEENNGKLEESINANANPEEGIADEAKVEAVDKERVEENIVNDNAVSDEELVGEEKKHEDMNQGNEGSEELKPHEGQDQVVKNVHEEEKAPDAADSSQKKQVVQGNKKESHAAYNDVIEETKNKLLEERKNKVKALVGAFETVIDYESGSK